MATHRIHLKGPWQFEPLRRTGLAVDSSGLPPAGRMIMPCSWQSALGDFRGAVRFTRAFHCPTNLDPDERVVLVFSAVGGDGEVRLDGHPLGNLSTSETPQAFDITDRLRPDMQLVVDLEFVSPGETSPGGLWRPIALEIHRPE
jgi:beta-galactosidase/beta-glucuronidase